MEITRISVQIHYSVFFHSLPLVSLPDKGNQENFSDCQTLKEKANVKQMKISDSKDFYTKDNNLKELLLTADTFRTELSLKLSRRSWLIYISDIFLSFLPPGQQQRYGDCQYLPAPASHLRVAVEAYLLRVVISRDFLVSGDDFPLINSHSTNQDQTSRFI